MDNIISTFCDQTQYVNFVGCHENSKSLVRDLKIHQLINSYNHLVVETENLNKDDLIFLYQFLRTNDLPFKIIIKNKLYMDLSSHPGTYKYKYRGGEQILYQSQLAFNLINNELKLIKNNIYSYLPKEFLD